MIYLFLGIYLTILILISIKSSFKVKGYSDFFVAKKKGNYFTITGSLLATILGGSAIIGAVEEGFRLGWATSWYMVCASIGLFALLPLTAKVNQLGKFTLPDLLEDMYSRKASNIASFIIPIAWLGIIAAQIIAAAKILQSFTPIGYETGAIIAGFVFIIYTIAGGQVSVLKTDLFQAILILLGLATIGYFTYTRRCNDLSSISSLKFPFNHNFKPFDLIILLITYATTFTAGPDIYSRIFCTNNKKTAQKAVLTTALILLPVAFTIGLVSVYGSNCLSSPSAGSIFVQVSNSILPEWAVALIVIALLSVILSSADTTILSASIIITGLIEKGKFGSTTVKTTRWTILVIGIISIIISLNFTSIIGILLIALTVYSGAFIAPILLGLVGLTTRSNYAVYAIAFGGIIALLGKIIYYAIDPLVGNIVIISSLATNAAILFLGKKHLQKTKEQT
jgi:solute:Na+ symporter, SSS family